MKTFLHMQRLLALIERKLRPLARRRQMTTQDLVLLAWLHADSGIGGAELASNSGRSRQNTQRALHRLRERGLVEPYVHDDIDRVIGWHLSEKGRAQWRDVAAEYDQLEQRFFVRGENRQSVIKFLERVHEEVIDAMRSPTVRPMPMTFGEAGERSATLTSKSTTS